MRGLIICIWISTVGLFGQSDFNKQKWINERLSTMSLDEKIGQLFIVRTYGRVDSVHIQSIEHLIKDRYIGGLCFFQGDAVVQADLTNYYQKISRTPLFISMDAEWSLGMRLKRDGFSYPKQLCLGAIKDNHLIYEMAKDIGSQLSRIGVNINFAPVVDINSNPNNPVINERSFGEDKINVTAKSYAYMLGLQSKNVLACAKHFPGHGDTEVDSHMDLPVIHHNSERLDTLELFPFKILSEKKVSSIMVAHLHVTSYNSNTEVSSSQSPELVTGLLRNKLKFNGLIVTDALEMKAVANKYKPGELELLSFKAGNDILLLSENLDSSIFKIKNAIESNEIPISLLDASVTRILSAKYDARLNELNTIASENLLRDIYSNHSIALKDKLYRKAITLIKDDSEDVPIRNVEQNIVSINIGEDYINSFQKKLSKYAEVMNYRWADVSNQDEITQSVIQKSSLVIISLHKLNYNSKKNFGLNAEAVEFINDLGKKKKVILCIFGNPYVVKEFSNVNSILLSYENNPMIQDITAEMLFGSDAIQGILPVNVSKEYKHGKSIKRPSLLRLGYTVPEREGLNSDSLYKIFNIACEIVESKTAPGCQILIAKNNKIVFNEVFGTLNYDSSNMAEHSTLYDIASITKIAASAPCLMKLNEDGKLNLLAPISKYVPSLLGSNKQNTKIKDVLLHQARWQSWIPYYKSTLISPDTLNILNPYCYQTYCTDSFCICVTDSLFLRKDYRDTIFEAIKNSPVSDSMRYLYSDLFYYYVPQIVERLTSRSFVDVINKMFWKPLGMNKTFFEPLKHNVELAIIAPTELDQYYRHREIRGHVHDMGSAMLGGISGHAGVFSNAEDLAILVQCLLNLGSYGGREYFNQSTIRNFIARDKTLNRRALVFDLPELVPTESAYVSKLAPRTTFGHTGFTGTCVWADPENNIIFIFLSNRTYPDGKVNQLHRQRYRMKIQDCIYQAMLNG